MVSRTVKPLILAKDCETPIPRREAYAILWSAASTHPLWTNHVLLRTGSTKTPVPHPIPTHIRAQLPYFSLVSPLLNMSFRVCNPLSSVSSGITLHTNKARKYDPDSI